MIRTKTESSLKMKCDRNSAVEVVRVDAAMVLLHDVTAKADVEEKVVGLVRVAEAVKADAAVDQVKVARVDVPGTQASSSTES